MATEENLRAIWVQLAPRRNIVVETHCRKGFSDFFYRDGGDGEDWRIGGSCLSSQLGTWGTAVRNAHLPLMAWARNLFVSEEDVRIYCR